MTVVSVPTRLRWCAGFLFLCIPLAAAEMALVSRLPWWQVPYQPLVAGCLGVAVISGMLASWVLRGKRWVLRVISVFFGLWVLLSAALAIDIRYPALGLFAVLSAPLFAAEALWLRVELGRSFFDPRLSWYEGAPQPIPALSGDLIAGEFSRECHISRVDEEGAFLFLRSPPGPGISFRRGSRVELILKFRNRKLRTRGTPRAQLKQRGWGVGIQFAGMNRDERKDLADFVETLRGEGYVE